MEKEIAGGTGPGGGAGVAAAVKAAQQAPAAAAPAPAPEEEEEDEEADGGVEPRGTVLWSAAVRCEPGRRCFAQYGVDNDELWFRATVTKIHRNDVGQLADVTYDDGDVEVLAALKGAKTLEESGSDSGED